jgi:hypothetical protein
VVTGEDTPDNFALLFGPSWENVLEIHGEQRMQILLTPSPPKGSPMHTMTGYLDKGCPKWDPRPASEAEKKSVKDFAEGVSQASMFFNGPQ